ncbi:TetR/AcrR family transcriptional regulator [Pseudonocardia kunmingensis]|uniref:TetR family transcriptional regulator n=1 Tax=Pseudonocardia kunmingensis TaxID=630975 RepID=A0A543DQN0_9PSEU|nr:TetR/AcrR family transcriptional regulator [Pseudonocardia kunmingensis]TQM11618.1 TetR family transcriptional regulator [Pseudonocardia kunmingensis]
MTAETVPAEVARLWGLSTSVGRVGRPPELDLEQVVRTAIELADRDGTAGVTLAKVATALGYTKMALYRHVGSKDELLELMADRATGPAPQITAAGWRAGLRQWAHALRSVYAAHPWITQLPVSGPPRGPHATSWLDALLGTLRGSRLDGGTKLGISVVLSGYVRNSSALAVQLAEGRSQTGMDQPQVEQDYARTMARLVDPERFPDAAALFATDPFASAAADPDPDFTFGLELILDGVATAIGERS